MTPDPAALRALADSWVRSFHHWGSQLRTARDPALRADLLSYLAGARSAVAQLRRRADALDDERIRRGFVVTERRAMEMVA